MTPFVNETVDASANTVGLYTSLALDAQGNPHISYYDAFTFNLKYGRKVGGVWTLENADASLNNVGLYTSLVLDAQGNPHIGYFDATAGDVKYARKVGGTWTLETAHAGASNVVGLHTSLALDAQGNPHISFYDSTVDNLKYADSGVHVVSPAGGENWPVGSLREVVWSGLGPVDILLSADGGATYDRRAATTACSP